MNVGTHVVAVAMRVPPDVIGVQVGVHDELDVRRA